MVGERGPEIIVPSRNGSVVPNNQLGGGGVTVVQNINITTGVQQTVRAEIKSLMPQIADSAKAAVLDARRRGGSYGSAFA
jgi:phage-related minor tail protein